jgi:hypothetical protein
MREINPQTFTTYANQLKMSTGLRRRLRPSAAVDIATNNWQHFELLGTPTKDGNAGILFIELHNTLYATTYELAPINSTPTGRAKPVICDFCKTWQSGGRTASITFRTKARSLDSVSFLCCADLLCSLHVRDKTNASKIARTQLREHLAPEQRVDRLQHRLADLVTQLALVPLSTGSE